MSHQHDGHVAHTLGLNSSGSYGIPDTHMGSEHSGHMSTEHHHMEHAGHAAHGGLDTGDSCATASHVMHMAFHGGFCETVLFETWKISSVTGLIASVIGIVIMSALYEGLKYYREYLFWKTYNALQYRSVSMPQEKNVVNDENRIVHLSSISRNY